MLQIPPNTKKERKAQSRVVCICVTRVWNPMSIIDVIWYAVEEREKQRGSGAGAGGGCEVKCTLDVAHPIQPQGRVLGYERERFRHLVKSW